MAQLYPSIRRTCCEPRFSAKNSLVLQGALAFHHFGFKLAIQTFDARFIEVLKIDWSDWDGRSPLPIRSIQIFIAVSNNLIQGFKAGISGSIAVVNEYGNGHDCTAKTRNQEQSDAINPWEHVIPVTSYKGSECIGADEEYNYP